MKLIFTIFVIFSAGLITAAQPKSVNADEKQNNNIVLKINNNKLTYIANNTSLAESLKLISNHYPIKFKITGHLDDDRRDWKIKDVTLDKALFRLLRKYSVVMYYQQLQESDTHRLFKVEIISDRAGISSQEKEKTLSSGNTTTMKSDMQDLAYKEVDRLQGLKDSITITQLSESLDSEMNSAARMRAADLLEEIGTNEAKMAVESALGDQDAEVRIHVVDLLIQREDDQTLLLLGQVIHGDPYYKVRIAALNGLQQLQSENIDVAMAFMNAATQDIDPRVAKVAQKIMSQQSSSPYPSSIQ